MLNWNFEKTIRFQSDGRKFCAVLYILVRDLFKECGISSFLKLKEIELAKENNCDFIQTYHRTDNLDFLPAITLASRTVLSYIMGGILPEKSMRKKATSICASIWHAKLEMMSPLSSGMGMS